MAVRKPKEWTVEEARRHLRALVGEAKQVGPLLVERPDDREALVVPLNDWATGDQKVEAWPICS